MQVKLIIDIDALLSSKIIHTYVCTKAMLESIGQLSRTNGHVRESGGLGSVRDAVLSVISGGSQVGGTLLRRCTRQRNATSFPVCGEGQIGWWRACQEPIAGCIACHGDDYPPLLLRPSLYPVWTSLSARHHLPARWPRLVIARVHYHMRSTLLHSHCFVQQPFFPFFFFFFFIASRSSTLISFVNKCACSAGLFDCLGPPVFVTR